MTLTKDITAKFAVAAVAVAMIFAAYAPAAQAQTTEDLQQMINDLLAQVAELQAQAGGEMAAPAGAPALCPYTWTRDLTMGSEGDDVMKLQQFLNSYPDLRVSATGAGAPGMETMYYGPATAAAVSKMQVMFRAEVLTPNGLVNPTGYFGASSRAKANDLCVTPVVDEGGEEGSEEEGSEEEEEMADLQGEGTLTTFEIDDEENEVSEGEEDVPVMSLTLEAENGDVEVARMTFTLTDPTTAGADDNEEGDPWDVFEEVSLWIDGDKVASFEADDEDNYLDEDAGEFRFSNLDLILREDDETEVIVAVSVMNSVDGSDDLVNDAADWAIEPTSVRYFDADGVAVTEDVIDEMTAGNDSEVFNIEEEGVDDGADLEGSSNNPDADTLLVDEDTDDSDEFVVHVFDIEVDNDSGDLELGDAFVDVTITDITGGADIAGGAEDVIDGIFMTIDGETVEGEATDSTAGGRVTESTLIDDSGMTIEYRFEFDQDVVLEGDEDYEVEVSIVFQGQDSNYVNGVTIETAVDGSDWEVEGDASDNELTGIDTSEEHTLSAADVDVTNYSWTAPSAGTFLDFNFTVEANEEDFDVLLSSFAYATSGTATTSGPVLSRTAGDAVENTPGSDYTVEDGETATFRIRWNLNGVNGATFDATATSVAGQTIPDEDEVSPTVIRNVN